MSNIAAKRASDSRLVAHTHAVKFDQLRPGWTWKAAMAPAAGKWVGRWVPKVKSKRQLEREAAFERLKVAWPLGDMVEVVQTDEGMQGSWFEAEIVGHEFDNKVVVKYLELHEGDDEAPEEQDDDKPPEPFVQAEPVKFLRPTPAKQSEDERRQWVSSLKPGSAADLWYDGGWWEVECVRKERKERPPARRGRQQRRGRGQEAACCVARALLHLRGRARG